MFYFYTFALVFFISFMSYSSDNEAGVKIALKQEVIQGIERKFLPKLAEKLKDFIIPDTEIPVDIGVGTLHIYLKNIHFSITNIDIEKVLIELNEPNKVFVHSHDIQGNGRLDVEFKLGFVEETDSVDVRVNRLGFDAEITLGTKESPKAKDKMMPSAKITNLSIDLDFDFDIHGKIIAKVIDLVKGKIKDYLNEKVRSKLHDIIIIESLKMISNYVDNFSVYVPLNEKGLAIDYSLLSEPRIINRYLIISSNGAIVNLNNSESMNPPFPYPTNLPDFNPQGKSIQMFISDFSINTAINSLYLSKMLEVMVKSEEVPDESPLQLNTTSLEPLIKGISKFYGQDKKIDLITNVTELPIMKMTDNCFNTTTEAEVSLLVRLENKTQDLALKFNTTLYGSADAHVQNEGQISAWIHNLEIIDTNLIETKLKDLDIKEVEKLINFSFKLLLPVLNKNYLKNLTVKLPTIEGISFNDSTAEIKNKYIEMNVNPKFDVDINSTVLHFLYNLSNYNFDHVKSGVKIYLNEDKFQGLKFLNQNN
jgi:hypothetical protein